MSNEKNVWLDYYGKHNISPVSQNKDDISIHILKREKLYRQLGIPCTIFKDKDILEVGPGSGYNTLAFFNWGGGTNSRPIELVEANPKGIADMNRVFTLNGIDKSKYKINEEIIEEYEFKKKFDIIIAEGFLHALPNSKEIIKILTDHTKNGGIIVVTCMDEASMFIESMKRLLYNFLTKDIVDYELKVSFGTNLFNPQMALLKGMSRSVEDWVRDDMLNPAFHSKFLLGISDAVSMFPKDFHFLGTSQKIFTDYSWYKDLEYDERKEIKTQYKEKRHNLMITGTRESIMKPESGEKLIYMLKKIKNYCIEYEKTYDLNSIKDTLDSLQEVLEILKTQKEIYEFVKEAIDIFEQLIIGKTVDLMVYKNFFKGVGRTQQYLSMVKQF